LVGVLAPDLVVELVVGSVRVSVVYLVVDSVVDWAAE